MAQLRLMPHGYTNTTVTDGRVVVKTYLGPDAADRQAREERALQALAGVLPVPALLGGRRGSTTTTLVEGVPAQEAIERGHASLVMAACGRLLRQLQAVDPEWLDRGDGTVLVHNDFGPNNVVMSPDLSVAVLLCDWEWVQVGDRLTDLAWAEFIVRMHHPDSVHALTALFSGYGEKPAWEHRQAAMTARASVHREFVRRWHGAPGAARWAERIDAIASWHEV